MGIPHINIEEVIIISSDKNNRQKILIADDSEMNRSILADMLGDEYEIIEAENGAEAVVILQKRNMEITLMLLDIVMPEMDGFEVLAVMNKNHWIEDIPVIMISAESSPSYVERAYELGITDFITRPFDSLIVHRRVVNTILLYAKQKKLIGLVAEQIYEKEKRSSLMIDILSHIVEFRNGESGLHVLHIHTLTELLLKCLVQKTNKYQLSRSDISLISTASALHDIGKIGIPEEILNKPGRLTREEFEIMKTHSVVGASMLKELPVHQDEGLVRVAYEICRWHHERYDGRGYPDGLKGEEIPISAQIVALADVYDALTSERVYKAAIPHEEAIAMILNGECGVFNPLLMECLTDISDCIRTEMKINSHGHSNRKEMRNITDEMLRHEELSASERTLRLLEYERNKYRFFASMSKEIQFEYTVVPSMITVSEYGVERLGVREITMDPLHDPQMLSLVGEEGLHRLAETMRNTSPEQPVIQYDCELSYQGELRWSRVIARATWSTEEPPQYLGCIGKVVDVHEERGRLRTLEYMASHDGLTGLLNHTHARKQIQEKLAAGTGEKYALAIIDLDCFKLANDNYGHIFGDHVLKYMAEKLRQNIRSEDIAARVGGDEFLLFFTYTNDLEQVIARIFRRLTGKYDEFPISVSIGVAKTEDVGREYEQLFQCADQALYTVKRSGRGQYQFYNDSMREMLSVISPIDGGSKGKGEE